LKEGTKLEFIKYMRKGRGTVFREISDPPKLTTYFFPIGPDWGFPVIKFWDWAPRLSTCK